MNLARQPDYLPTNKATVAALIGPAVMELWQALAPVAATGPAVSALVGALAALAVAWFVPDRLNDPRGKP